MDTSNGERGSATRSKDPAVCCVDERLDELVAVLTLGVKRRKFPLSMNACSRLLVLMDFNH